MDKENETKIAEEGLNIAGNLEPFREGIVRGHFVPDIYICSVRLGGKKRVL